jgi:uncharacterized protein (DUF1330 family)
VAAYLIVELVELSDLQAFNEYRRATASVIAEYDGDYLALTDQPIVIEGTWGPNIVAVIRFPSIEHVRDMFDSPHYQPLRDLRQRAGKFNFVALPGIG